MGCFGYKGEGINWCSQLNEAFDEEMFDAIVDMSGVLWSHGKHELYCMGGEL